MSGTPTPKQALILWCLLGRCGSAAQSSLVPKVGKADREALVADRLVVAERQGRSLRLTVTDRGWDWAGAHLREPLPPGFRVLQDWLARMHAHLEREGRTLADLVGPAPAEPEAAGPAPDKPPARPRRAPAAKPSGSPSPSAQTSGPKSPTPKKPPAPKKSPTPKQIRARIEQAYLALTSGERAKAVRLSALRAQLSELDRATVDAGLAAILRGDGTARLSQFSDPKSLDNAERAAAYAPAGEPFHILRIQS